ncbi:hypothetical protein [Bifidobacterium vansinderenii]|uniref:Uncharacterized protein n=1 Tax=Bifidobacterium vansinderenii TaxID=1984871 RepID=A0A229VVS1_9BIFI|nr:hypothetical protein [Bifidobacterium vansinderenii]OXM99713.1 hypothetical protein Tam10B_2031 [Bifidobacterium vansinderenii]
MRILEQRTLGKRADARLNEDGLYIGEITPGTGNITGKDGIRAGNNGFAAVVDGVTSKSTTGIWHPSPGVVAKDAILEALRAAPRDTDMRGMQRLIDEALRAEYARCRETLDGRDFPAEETTEAQGETATGASTSPVTSTATGRSNAAVESPTTVGQSSEAKLAYFRDHPNDRLQANAVIYSEALHEIWLFGDCQAMVNGRTIPTTKRVDLLLGELRSFAWQALELQRSQQTEPGKRGADAAGEDNSISAEAKTGARPERSGMNADAQTEFSTHVGLNIGLGANNDDATERSLNPSREPNNDLADATTGNPTDSPADGAVSPDPAREMIMPFLRLQSRFANRRGEYGYFVFDGFTDPKYPIRTISIRPGDEVVLASDGYPKLCPTLAESERELERLRREDPHLVCEFRTTKGFTPSLESFDDRTYIRFVA